MSEPRRPGWFRSPFRGSAQTRPQDTPPSVDPAYADQAPYAPPYEGGYTQPYDSGYSSYGYGYGPPYGYGYTPQRTSNPNETLPTTPLPVYWRHERLGDGLPDGPPAPPGESRSPRWLWISAGAAVLLAVSLVIALVLANHAVKNQTAVPPLPAMPESSPTTTTSRPPRTHTAVPAPPLSPSESPSETTTPVSPTETTPTETTAPAAMQNVVYDISGDGRAISVTYWGTGDVISTEFNVALPWSKEVTLSQSAPHPPSVTIINIGHNVTCTLTVDGVQVRQRVGAGITVCDAPR